VSIRIFDGQVYMMTKATPLDDELRPTGGRRRHSKEFKEKAIRAAMQPHVSIAAVALHYRLNANLLRRWVAATREASGAPAEAVETKDVPAAFVPLQLDAPANASGSTDIQIEIHRGAATVTVRWPVSAAGECATWLQDWLR